ncbi:MAG: 2-oxoacid:acceptor oxidoreductase subunit alpha [Nitriliruptorales bacterium]|nr:2-oxoacid:acceptor oxidoreductase subunit alpha [Nitriliruptorales bacterium]
MSSTTSRDGRDVGDGLPTPTDDDQPTIRLTGAVVRFAGDSGDGMQLTGDRFTAESAAVGNDLATLPDYPAEIRAPAGTLAGVSSFQLHFSEEDIHTPGDAPDVLVAMNPAALMKHLGSLKSAGTLIVNKDAFTDRNLKKAGYEDNPLEDGSLEDYTVHEVSLTDMTLRAVEDLIESGDINKKEAERAKNMFALGLVSWMFSRPIAGTEEWLERKFKNRPAIAEANLRALRAGRNFGETTESFRYTYEVPPAKLQAGRYRNITGNTALAYGLIAASKKAGLPLFYGSYPITPASDILHELAKQKHFGVRTFQAEDEIAAVGSAIGASFGGSLAVTASSGPGVALKTEAIGLALAIELPLVIVNVQRGGPSTGLPTKTEQADLLQVMFGRNGEAPLPVVAAQSPSDCFYAAFEAARLAIENRTPVFLLSDGYLANSAEPWLLPEPDELPDIDPAFASEPNTPEGFLPYLRDPETLARPWAVPGVEGLQHRVGGLEKWDGSGDISYDPANHHHMTEVRHEKVRRIADRQPDVEVDDPDGDADLLVIGWGSTYGPIRGAVQRIRERGGKVARIHLRVVNPLPNGLGEVLERYDKVLCPENNMGQLRMLLRSEFLVDIEGYNRVTGLPFTSAELVDQIEARMEVPA